MKIKLTSEYLKNKKINSDGVYDVSEERARELVKAGNAVYLDKLKEVKDKKTKIMRPSKKRTYKTK